MTATPALVAPQWLKNNLDNPHIVVVDASWHLPDSDQNALADFRDAHIPGAMYFDIAEISDQDTDLPNMLPPASQFERQVSALGIGNDDHVIIYDTHGIFSAPRAWWMFRYFGHNKVSVLDGGLPLWLSQNLPTESGKSKPKKQAQFKAAPQPGLLRDFNYMDANTGTKTAQVVDLRSRDRFDGQMEEPWPGALRGHIEHSRNLHYKKLLTEEGRMKPPEELQNQFLSAGIKTDQPIITSCGSGISACIGALALYAIGKPDVPVYDGSWAEWSVRKKASQ